MDKCICKYGFFPEEWPHAESGAPCTACHKGAACPGPDMLLHNLSTPIYALDGFWIDHENL